MFVISVASRIGEVLRYCRPTPLSCARVIGKTNIPSPPRITVLLCKRDGVHANPMRGLARCDVFLYTAVSPFCGKRKPPGTLKFDASNCGTGFFAYAAIAAGPTGFC